MHGDIERNIPAEGETDEVPLRLLSLKDAALSLGKITERELRKRADANEIETVYIGRRRLVPLDAIDAYVARLREEAAARRAA